MPRTSKAMKKLLAKKNNPILELWQNKKFNQLQKPMTFDDPVVKKQLQLYKFVLAEEVVVMDLEDRARDQITKKSTNREIMNTKLLNVVLKIVLHFLYISIES